MFDSLPDPVVIVDVDGCIEWANPAARRFLGVSASDELAIAWEPPLPLAVPLSEALSGGADFLPTGLEHSVRLQGHGRERYFLPRVLAIRDVHDQPQGAAVVLTDVTECHLADRLKGEMVSTAAHELRLPLCGILMAVELVLEQVAGPLTPQQSELLALACRDINRMLGTVEKVLDLSRIERGRIRLDLQSIAARCLSAEAVQRYEAWPSSRESRSRSIANRPFPKSWPTPCGSASPSTT
jgi:signal transduction histidine kinase